MEVTEEEIRAEEVSEEPMEEEREAAMVDMAAGVEVALGQMLEVMVAVELEEVRNTSQYTVRKETQ